MILIGKRSSKKEIEGPSFNCLKCHACPISCASILALSIVPSYRKEILDSPSLRKGAQKPPEGLFVLGSASTQPSVIT